MADRYWPSVTVDGRTIDHADGYALLDSAKVWIAFQLEECATWPSTMPEQADALSELVELVELIEGDGPYWQRSVAQTGFTARAVIERRAS